MVKIKSYKNHEEYFCFGTDKEQELIPKLREFLEELGENQAKHQFKKYEDPEVQGGEVDARVEELLDDVNIFALKDCKVIIFFGKDKMYITAIFDKKNRAKILEVFNKIFNPEPLNF